MLKMVDCKNQCVPSRDHTMLFDVRLRKCKSRLCQNCVRYTSKPWSNIVVYEDMPMHIGVAGTR
jgi:hypothetical protein